MQQTPRVDLASSAPHPLTVRWPDGRVDLISAVWLRDACSCPACRQTPDGQRLWELHELGPDIRLVGAAAESEHLAITFGPEPHEGQVSWAQLARRTMPSPEPTRWRSGFERRLAERAWRMGAGEDHEDDRRARFMQDLASDGIALVHGVPTVDGAVLEFARRVGFVRETNYGALFDVRSVPNPDNLAYSSVGLSPHTDNPYRDPAPTVQLLHCLQATTRGGESQFVDGFAVADELQRTDPEAFALLSAVSVDFRYWDDDVDLVASGPIIEHAADGRLRRIRWNNRSMQPPRPAGLIDWTEAAFYRACRMFGSLLASPDLVVPVKLGPGDLIAFDNHRVLHGRSEYPADEPRHLQGCYIDIDAIRSAARIADR